MIAGKADWSVVLTEAAKADLRGIVNWTADQFGDGQARTYAKIIHAALNALADGPAIVGVRARDDIAGEALILHTRRFGRNARHLLVFRIASYGGKSVQVLRILHDSMDVPRHIGEDDVPES